ncbi:transcription regulatory protein, ArsR family [Thiobacillus denitrificans ATCC 25259]|uniref:Transcription regulatory protein, ArsR family n=1 Tax=Thiobacillus denitrificans (strain ATCC 25259 / T1) TaxID=292415 RepID=Q3SFC0_THIDA|nr:metalloregulator ArsR/SmtB family transcription factor [Thiobacillus denitrificans]AAZ98692.1 transcription regulatory protein, ArsR family [Thiobacillus denitrificans ATCC 25259]
MQKRELKNLLYEQVARIGRAVSSPKRLELLEILAQGEKTVEVLASEAAIDVKLASAHLKVLKEARLVETRREGRFVAYRLSGDDVSALWVDLRTVAEEHLVELKVEMERIFAAPEKLDVETRRSLLAKARRGDVVVIDVRPAAEYATGHLPFARSMPLEEIRQRLKELPADRDIVAYCRGPFCMMSAEAVALLKEHGYRAHKIADGVPEWQAAGLPLAES